VINNSKTIRVKLVTNKKCADFGRTVTEVSGCISSFSLKMATAVMKRQPTNRRPVQLSNMVIPHVFCMFGAKNVNTT
jgi:hypothetical protein